MSAFLSFVTRHLRIVVTVLTTLGLAGTILGCGPGEVRVVASNATAFQAMLSAEMAADARRPAHWMRDYVSGEAPGKPRVLEPEHLPEAYTPNGEPGIRPSEFHLAYAALRLICAHYAATHPGYRGLERDVLVEVVDEAGGNTHMVNEFDRERRLDLVDVEDRFLFEVVPPGQMHQEAGKKKVDWQLLLLNKAMLGVPEFKLGTGYEGEIGVRFAEGAPGWKLTFATTTPGIVQYEWHVLSVDEATEEAYREAYLDNRWHAPTPDETMRFARALHEVVERLVQAREALGRTRAVAEMPILPGNTVADDERSVALWSAHDDRIARLLPIVRPGARGGMRVPEPVAKRLGSCPRRSAARLKPARYSMSINVYVTDEGRAVSAFVKRSTLGDGATEACMLGVLRETQWPVEVGPEAAAPTSRAFVAQAAERITPLPDRPSGIYPKQPSPGTPPQGFPNPYYVTIPLGPVIVGVGVGVTIFLLPRATAPAWASELNPITRLPYTSAQEYEEVRRLSPDEIKRRRARITGSKPNGPPASTPTPSTQAAREQEKKTQRCAKIAKDIHDIIYAERKATPKGGFPQGRKGLATRWREIAENEGNWGRKPDGTLIKKAENHLKEYEKGQREVKQELEKWKGCDDKDLPRLAREYAEQKPEFGPGKPLEPKPQPLSPKPGVSVVVPKDKKRSD
ncbi:MAG: hypothetical protein IPM54_09715 [Polyangiaceae bacterium]|nr:hypothetical protein [Polyangiaceae bacterium]